MGPTPRCPTGHPAPGTQYPAPMAMSRRLARVGGGTGGGMLGAHPNGVGYWGAAGRYFWQGVVRGAGGIWGVLAPR